MLQERHLTKGTFEIKSRVVFNCNIIAYRYSKIRQKKKPHHYFWLGLRKANSQLVKTNTKKKIVWGSKGEIGALMPQRVILTLGTLIDIKYSE